MLSLPQITTKEEDEEFLKIVASNVKIIRQECGLSQLETALSIGQASNGFYANMENFTDQKRFNLLHLYKLPKLFRCNIDEFFKDIK